MVASRKFIGVLLFQLLILLNNYSGILCSSDQYEGDECEWKGKRGVCVSLKNCQSLTKELSAKTITFSDLENCAFNGNDYVACCTDIDPSALPRKSDTSSSGSTIRPNVYFPSANTTATSPTRSPSITENFDSSENGNSIDKEVTTIGSAWRPGDDPFAAFEFRTTTARPIRDLDSILNDIINKKQSTTSSPLSAITSYPLRNIETSTTKPQVLDPWMVEAISNKSATVKPISTTTTTTTTTTPRPDIGFIDLSKKRTTTTTSSPSVIPNGVPDSNNLQTVWVVQDPPASQNPNSRPNGQLSNWNGGLNQQNWNKPIQQQQVPLQPQQPNWNRPIQQSQHQQNWNKPSDPVTVVVIEEEEPNWNRGRGSRFRQNRQQNWNVPNSGFTVVPNNQQQFQTEHHTWNGNSFNQGRPTGNSNQDFVAFPVAIGPNNQVSFGNTNNGAIQLTSATTQPLNPDNPFLKPLLNSVSSSQLSSAQIVQLQPGWSSNNNNNRQSRVFQRF